MPQCRQKSCGNGVRFFCSLGGSVLWPAASPPEPSPCHACGAPRTFELQAMPALHAALSEGLTWRRQHLTVVGGGSEPNLDDWGWLTVAVFTCSRACSAEGACTFVEEEVFLVNE